MQLEVLHLMIKFIIQLLPLSCIHSHQLSLLSQILGPLGLYRGEIANQAHMPLDKAVLVSALILRFLFPLATDKIVFKVSFIGIVVLYLPSVEVLDLQVWEAYCENHVAPCDREERDIDFLILKAVFSNQWQHNGTTWTLNCFVTIFFNWLAIFFIGGEVDRQFDLGPLLLQVRLSTVLVSWRGATALSISRPTIICDASGPHILPIEV